MSPWPPAAARLRPLRRRRRGRAPRRGAAPDERRREERRDDRASERDDYRRDRDRRVAEPPRPPPQARPRLPPRQTPPRCLLRSALLRSRSRDRRRRDEGSRATYRPRRRLAVEPARMAAGWAGAPLRRRPAGQPNIAPAGGGQPTRCSPRGSRALPVGSPAAAAAPGLGGYSPHAAGAQGDASVTA